MPRRNINRSAKHSQQSTDCESGCNYDNKNSKNNKNNLTPDSDLDSLNKKYDQFKEYENLKNTLFIEQSKCTQQCLQQCPQQYSQHLQNTNNHTEFLMHYMKLIIEKQDFMIQRINNLDNTISKLANDGKEIKSKLESIECDTFNISDRLEDMNDTLNEKKYETIDILKKRSNKYNNSNDEIDDTEICDNPNCIRCNYKLDEIDNEEEAEDKGEDNSDSSDNSDESTVADDEISCGDHSVDKCESENNSKKKKNKSNNFIKANKFNKPLKNDSLFQMNSSFPMELLMGKLNESLSKRKIEKEETCSDDEYDQNAPIYETNEINNLNNLNDSNFVEMTEKIADIGDLIDIAEKYKDMVNSSIKKREKNTKKKQKKNKLITNENLNATGYYEYDGKKFPINLETIVKLSVPLKRLLKMVGMEKVKNDIFDMIIYYLQGFENKNNNMLHSVIEGPPGVGKTKLGKILSGVYCALGIIESNKFKYVKATDLIGEHVGATKHMTQNVIDEANGGVLFIDEAYALSTSDNKDPYGKECIDTINFNLSENKKKLIVIIAGYPDHLDKYFFSFNPGLARRFPFKFRIDAYSSEELKEIFIDKLRKFGWKFNYSVTMEKLSSFFKTNEKEFPNFGGDIENFFKSCQLAHSKRMIGKNPNQRKKFDIDDIKQGLEKFKKNKRIDDTKSQIWKDMFI